MLALYISSSSFITFIPYHDVIKFPEFWYEFLFPGIFGFSFIYILLILLQIEKLLDEPAIVNVGFLCQLFTIPAIVVVACHTSVHIIWSTCLGYNSPMPFVSCIDTIPMNIAVASIFWHYFRENCETDYSFKRKI